jgi:hypothetical protein
VHHYVVVLCGRQHNSLQVKRPILRYWHLLIFFRPPLWSSGRSSWLQIRRPGFDSRHYQKKVVGLERDPLSLVSTTEELLDKSSGSCLENREYGREDPSRWPRSTLYPQKLAVTSLTSGSRTVGVVRSRTHTMEFFLIFFICFMYRSKWIIVRQFSWYISLYWTVSLFCSPPPITQPPSPWASRDTNNIPTAALNIS